MRQLRPKQITLGYSTAAGLTQAGQQLTNNVTNDIGACMIVNFGKGLLANLGTAPVCAVGNTTDTWSRGLAEEDEGNQSN